MKATGNELFRPDQLSTSNLSIPEDRNKFVSWNSIFSKCFKIVPLIDSIPLFFNLTKHAHDNTSEICTVSVLKAQFSFTFALRWSCGNHLGVARSVDRNAQALLRVADHAGVDH